MEAQTATKADAAKVELHGSNIIAAITFSMALNPWSRLKVWKIIPIFRPLKRSLRAPCRS